MNPELLLRCLRAAACAFAALAGGAALAQKIDDVPPEVQNNVPPNFMFMIDNSGSMSNIVPSAPYSATATYTASCTSNVVPASTPTVDIRVVSGEPRFSYGGNIYRHTSTTSGREDVRCFDNNATYNARLLADNAVSGGRAPGSYLDTEYKGHFLNWYFGRFDGPMTGWIDRKLLTTGSVSTRMEIARRSARTIVDALPLTAPGGRAAVRLGLSTYRSGGGALRVQMQDLDATLRTTLKNSIDALTPSGNTPLATTFADIARYLATGYVGNVTTARSGTTGVNIDRLLRIDGTDNGGRNACLSNVPVACDAASPAASQKPIQFWCQRSAIVAMTDGRPQGDRGFDNNDLLRDYDGDCSGVNSASCKDGGAASGWDRKLNRAYESAGSDYMDDVAKLLFDVDWRPDLAKPAPVPPAAPAKNNIRTYLIGFADPAVQNDPLLLNTARQGGGLFIPASDETTLNEAFRSVMADALDKSGAASAVDLTSGRVTAGTVEYASSFNAGTWVGSLEPRLLDQTTAEATGDAIWNARDKLEEQNRTGTRRIVSFDGRRGLAFTRANIAAFAVNAPSLTEDLIDYTRGSRSGEGTRFRTRPFVLGDTVHADPVAVSYGDRNPIVFQAANDGMLHAFDGRVEVPVQGPDTRGQELWAYVPALVHSKLAGRADLLFEHEYLLDATPAVASITGAGTVTRLLVGGLGKGGAGYYALDITSGTAATEEEAAAKVLWEVRPANMGYSFGKPLIVNTAAGWKVVLASGYRNDTATGGVGGDGRARVWVLHPVTGAVEKVFVSPAGFGSTTASLGLAHLGQPQNVSASAVVRFVYGGDLQGNVWRVDLDAANGSSLVRVAAATAPNGTAQPIAVRPVVAPVVGTATSFFLYFGTGQYFSAEDVPGTATPNAFATQVQTIYGIVDDASVASPPLPNLRGSNGSTCPSNGGNGALVCQSATATGNAIAVSHNQVNLSSRRGFYLDLPLRGQRVVVPITLTAGGTLVVPVNVPASTTCNPGGSSGEFSLSALNGGAVAVTYGGSEYYAAYQVIGDALTSGAIALESPRGRKAVVHLSDGTTRVFDIPETRGLNPAFRRIYMRPLN